MSAGPPKEVVVELGANPADEPLDFAEWTPGAKTGYVVMIVILAALAGVVVQIGYVSFMEDARTELASAKLGAVPNDTVLLALLPVRPPGFDAELFE